MDTLIGVGSKVSAELTKLVCIIDTWIEF